MNKLHNIFYRLVAIAALLGISSGALANYFMYGTNDDYSGWSNSVTTTGSSPTYTAVISGLTAGNGYYVAYTGSSASTSGISTSAVTITATGMNWYNTQERSGKYYIKFATTSATSVTITYNTSTRAYTVTAGCSATAPTVATGAASSITLTSVSLAGSVSNNGQTTSCTSATLTQTGIEWTRTVSPVSANGRIYSATPSAEFTVNVTSAQIGSFVSGSTYYYRAVAINSNGLTSYGAEQSFTVTATTTVPTVRIGSQISEDASYNVSLGGYVAATGCSAITKFTIYYSKSTISSKTGSGVFKKEISASSPAVGSNTTLTLPSSDISSHSWGNEDMYVRITATNGVGESELSDEVVLSYVLCTGIITELNIVPASTSVEINKAQTFSYTTNTGAVVNSVKWYKDNTEVGTGSTYTFTPTTTTDFTIGLKAVNTSCNPAPGFAAEDQTYTVCSPITGVTITDCPATDAAIGTPITLHATITGAASADKWEWRVNDGAQAVTESGANASITFTPREAKAYISELVVTDCLGVEHSTECSFNAASLFTANDLTGKSFTACKGNHQFKWSDMFSPEPDSWSVVVTGSSTNAKSQFTLDDDGYMVWDAIGKASGSYSFTFTATKAGFKTETAVLEFTYTANAPTATLSDITITSGSSPTYPYVKIGLSCSIASGSANDIGWSVNNGGLVVHTGKGTAYFKGKSVKTATTYTVTAVGLSETCGATAGKTIDIVVNPEPAEDCD